MIFGNHVRLNKQYIYICVCKTAIVEEYIGPLSAKNGESIGFRV